MIFVYTPNDSGATSHVGVADMMVQDSAVKSRSNSLDLADEATAPTPIPKPAPAYAPDEFEREHYYNGINGDRPHAKLLYRSDYATPFPHTGTHLPVKTMHPGGCDALRNVWDTVGRQVADILTAKDINWQTMDVVSFTTHQPPDEDEWEGTRGPTVIWVSVVPDSTSVDAAHEAAQEVLAILREKEVDDVEVEYREALIHFWGSHAVRAGLAANGEEIERPTGKKKGKKGKRRARQ